MDFQKNFFFYGFISDKKNKIQEDFKELSNLNSSIVFFISPNKIMKILPTIKKNFTGRKILICREMTKHFEEFIRTDVEKIDTLQFELKGELTIVISEKKIVKNTSQILDESDKKIINQMINKISIKDIINIIQRNSKISKKDIYNYCIKLKNEK